MQRNNPCHPGRANGMSESKDPPKLGATLSDVTRSQTSGDPTTLSSGSLAQGDSPGGTRG